MAVIDELELQIQGESTNANKAIDLLVNKLSALSGALKGVSGSNVSSVVSGIRGIGTSVQTLKGVGSKKFDTIADGIERISNVNVSSANFIELSNALRNLSVGASALKGISANTSLFVDAIARLSVASGGISTVVSVLPAFSRELSNFATTMSSAAKVSSDTTNFVLAISSLANAGIKTSKTAAGLSNLAIELKKVMQILSTAPTVSANVIQMTNALASLSSQGGKVGKATNSLTSGMTKAGTSMKGFSLKAFSLASIMGTLYANFFLVIRGIKKLWQSIEDSMDFIEVLNYFDSAFGQVASKANLSAWEELGYNSAEAYYNSFTERALELTEQLTGYTVGKSGLLESTGKVSLGINPTSLMNYQAIFGQISSSMGVTAESSLVLSNVLTRLGGDLASIKNMNFEDVWKDMASGIVGMSRSVDKYGSNIRNVNLQQKLIELGIEASITTLNQEEKALARGIIMLESTEYAWGDLAKTLYQPANQLRLLEANFDTLTRTIGDIFIPVISRALIFINALVKLLSEAAEKVRDFFNITNNLSKDTGIGSIAADLMGSLQDELDGALESVSELKNELLGFDEINKLSDSSGLAVGTSIGLPEADLEKLEKAFLDIAKRYEKESEEAYGRLENHIEVIKSKMIGIFSVPNTKSLEDKMANIKTNVDSIATSFKNIWNNQEVQNSLDDLKEQFDETFENLKTGQAESTLSIFSGFSSGIAEANKNLEGFKTEKLDSIINTITELLDTVGGLGDIWTEVSKVFESPAAKSIISTLYSLASVTIINAIDKILGLGKDIIGFVIRPFVDNKELITELFQEVLEVVEFLISPLKTVVDILTSNLKKYEDGPIHAFMTFLTDSRSQGMKKMLEFLISAVKNFKENLVNAVPIITSGLSGILNNAANLFSSKNWTFSGIKDGLKTAFDNAFNGISVTAFYNKIKGFFDKNDWNFSGIKDGLKTAFDNAIEAIKKVWNTFADGLNAKLTFKIDPIKVLGKTIFAGTTLDLGKIPKFWTGGFPEDGLFMANHGELVGQFSNGRTAVANNTQIVEGIEGGVERAVAKVLAPYLADIAESSRITSQKEFGISERAIFRSAQRQARNYTTQTGLPAF